MQMYEAAYQALKEIGAPTHVQELWQQIQDRGYFTFGAKDPSRRWASVLIAIVMEREFGEYRKLSFFTGRLPIPMPYQNSPPVALHRTVTIEAVDDKIDYQELKLKVEFGENSRKQRSRTPTDSATQSGTRQQL